MKEYRPRGRPLTQESQNTVGRTKSSTKTWRSRRGHLEQGAAAPARADQQNKSMNRRRSDGNPHD